MTRTLKNPLVTTPSYNNLEILFYTNLLPMYSFYKSIILELCITLGAEKLESFRNQITNT